MANRQIRKMPYFISQCMVHVQGYSNEIGGNAAFPLQRL